MPFPEFDPVLISIGPLDIRWYALAYVGGIVLGWWYAAKLIRNTAIWAPGKPPLSTIQLDDLILWITLGIILGGRFGYALFYKPELYSALFTGVSWGDRLALFRLWDGGMSFHGGMIGTTLAVLIFAFLLVYAMPWIKRNGENLRWVILPLFAWAVATLSAQSFSPFLYFQF